ncbi:four helix bundle protein [Candidatus Thiosymbion oneisti]|uniref:four helix bundle protein n=1 Tax=Candidatus Thiosymbion oneisti TaxID=589554 RepID=UPI0021097544|nr:four helix bundle protein [Candidatus Thiosymbion oneisti]
MVLLVYQETQRFPADEWFGLISQMRRAATSIPSNIAEGSGRGSDQDFARFARIAAGSTNEI